ncbi:MAG: hypothetical protein R3B40_06085 [Polyangiales bacterium]|nr:hypothetical protein [Sandaracinaceae bacterium]
MAGAWNILRCGAGSMGVALLAVGLALGLALGCGAGPEPVLTEPPGAQAELVEAPPGDGAPYALHEWGLLDAPFGTDQAQALAGALPVASASEPGARIPSIDLSVTNVDKPVLYFHLDDGADALSLALTVTPSGGGRVLEHYPQGVLLAEGGLRYAGVRVTRGDCTGIYPAPSAPCSTADGVCEVRELARYETDDADCVHVGDDALGFLFYRTGPARATLPLEVSVATDTAVRVTQRALTDTGAPRVAGWVMRVYRPGDRSQTRARVVALDGEAPAVIERADEHSLGAEQAEARLGAALVAAGLTNEERDAFLRAWSAPLFGTRDEADMVDDETERDGDGIRAETIDVLSADRAGSLGIGAAQDALLYVLPQASVDALLPLRAEPTPRVTRRAFVVRVNLLGTHPLHVTVARASSRGPLSAEVGRRILRQHVAAFGACLAGAREPHETTLAIGVSAAGQVTNVTLGGASWSPNVRACLEAAARAVTFPAVPGASTLDVTLRGAPRGF